MVHLWQAALPLKHGVLKHGSDNQMLMSSVHGIVHGAQDEGSIRGKNLRGDGWATWGETTMFGGEER